MSDHAPAPVQGATRAHDFPVSAGILLGLALGGFFDGVVFHQLLQWHHVLSHAGHAPTELAQMKFNVFWDGLFHGLTYGFLVAALAVLWRASRRSYVCWSGRTLLATLLLGFGMFNLVEGIVDHHVLQIHHVNETVPQSQWLSWDMGFLLWGAAMAIAGWRMLRRSGRAQSMRADATTNQ